MLMGITPARQTPEKTVRGDNLGMRTTTGRVRWQRQKWILPSVNLPNAAAAENNSYKKGVLPGIL
jgi:hypothetical protein